MSGDRASIMHPERRCPQCGEPLPADAAGGNCPDCILRAGFQPRAETALALLILEKATRS